MKERERTRERESNELTFFLNPSNATGHSCIMLEFIQGLLGSGLPTVSQHVHHTNTLTSAIDLLHWLPQNQMDNAIKTKRENILFSQSLSNDLQNTKVQFQG